MSAKIRMGVIGVGGISSVHIGGIQRSPDACLCAICDTDREVLRVKGDALGIAPRLRFDRFEDLLASDEVDAVSNCTPNNVHLDVLCAAAAAGKPIASEKPMTLDLAQAERARQTLRSHPVPHMICFSYRFKAAARYARHLILSGQIGKLRHVYAQYFQAWGDNPEGPKVWRFDRSVSGSGALGDLGSHALDLVRFLTGQEYTGVMAQTGTFIAQRPALSNYDCTITPAGRTLRKREGGTAYAPVDVDDYSHMLLTLTNGAAATFGITRFAYGRGNYQRVEVYGSKGALVYELEADDDRTDKLSVCIGGFYGENHLYRRVPVPPAFHSDQMQSFFDLVNGHGDGLTATVEDGYQNMAVMDACLRSAQEGRLATLR